MKKVLAWIIGVFFALGAIAGIAQGEIVAFIAFAIPAFLLLPPTAKLIKFKMHWVVKLIIIMICLGLSTIRVTEKGKAEMAASKEKARVEAEVKAKEKAIKQEKDLAAKADKEAKAQADKSAEETKKTKGSTSSLLSVKNSVVMKSFPVCVSKEAHKELISLQVKKDQPGLQYLFNSQQCIFLKEGIRISILDLSVFSATKIRAYVDSKTALDLYTDREYVYEK